MIVLHNRTPHAAQVVQGVVPPEPLDLLNPAPRQGQVLVVVKAAFTLEKGEAASPAAGSKETYVRRSSVAVPAPQLPIVAVSAHQPAGYVEGDLCSAKEGADLVILGSARPFTKEPCREMQVALKIGDWQRVLQLSGDRVWKKKLFSWVHTDPAPFTEMPLTYDRAFGGKVRLADGSEKAFASNPLGKGWLPRLKGVERDGAPLPNIEDLGGRVATPEDEPDPAGFAWYPLDWGLRRARLLEIQEDPAQLFPRLWNAAHPSLVLPTYPQGQRLRLHGMGTEGPLDFAVPGLGVTLVHDLQGTSERCPAKPDTLVLYPGQRSLFVLARWLLPYDPAACPGQRAITLIPE